MEETRFEDFVGIIGALNKEIQVLPSTLSSQ